MKIKIEYDLPENPQNFPDIYDFLILAPSEYSAYLSPLVDHKNNHNISTKLVTLEEIDGTGRGPGGGCNGLGHGGRKQCLHRTAEGRR